MAKKEEISIFGGAKTKTPSVAKKDDKEVVLVKGLEEKLLEFEFIKAQIKDLTAQEKTLNSEIKDIAKEKFVELYQSKRSNPNTFLIKDGEGCVMILPSDAYIKIGSEARANELMEAYGDDAVTVDEQFVFNNSVLQRNMKAIEKAIRDAKGVSDDDKRDLIDRIVEFKVAKGFIDRLYEYGDNMETVMNDIQPIISLKSCGGGRMEDGGELDGDFMGNIYGDGESRVVSIEEVRDDGEFMDSYMIDESQAVSNAGEQESWFYNGKNYLITTWNERAVEHNDGDEEISVNDEYIGRVYTVWVGGSEVNDNLLTRSEAEDLANEYREDGYDDVVVVDNTYPISEGEYRKGGRVYETGRAYKRDRAYKSNQPHELAYRRKTRPKNPRYKKDTSFFADGGGVEKFNIGDKVKVVKGANKGVKGVISNTDSDFFGDYTIDVRGHKLGGFKADSLTKLPKYKMMADGGGVGKVVTDLTTLNAIAKKYSLSFDRRFKYYDGDAYKNSKGEPLLHFFTHKGRVFELKYFDGSFSPFLVELNPKHLVYDKDTHEPAFKNYPNPKWDTNKYYTKEEYAEGGGVGIDFQDEFSDIDEEDSKNYLMSVQANLMSLKNHLRGKTNPINSNNRNLIPNK